MVNLSNRYAVEFMPIDDIYPSPENDEIYGKVEHDNQMDDLIESIREHGLEEPLGQAPAAHRWAESLRGRRGGGQAAEQSSRKVQTS